MINNNKTVLVFPQTKQNYHLLAAYLQNVTDWLNCKFIKTNLFGSFFDGKEESYEGLPKNSEVISPSFLNVSHPPKTELMRLIETGRKSSLLWKFITDRNPAAIVVGVDNYGIGGWVTAIAKKKNIKTIVCQEGNRNLVAVKDPLIIHFKRKILSFLSKMYGYNTFNAPNYASADSVCVWGELDRKIALKNRHGKGDIFIIGHPFAYLRNAVSGSAANKLLFLDIPAYAWSKGVIDIHSLNNWRNDFSKIVEKNEITTIWKLHPLTPTDEINNIKAICNNKKHIKLITEGAAEQYYKEISFCLTFPSTSIYTILSAGLPLIIILAKFRGLSKLLWDPIREFNAGIQISKPDDLIESIKIIKNKKWQNNYYKSSLKAAEYVLGPLDGKVSQHFAQTIQTILLKQGK